MALSGQGLAKRYGLNGYVAVQSADLDIEPGELVTIIGRSGSGKSSLLAMLGALTRPTEGNVLVDGHDVWSMSEDELATFRAKQIGFVFQFPSLLPNLRAVDNVALPALLSNSMDRDAAYSRALALLASVGLASRAQSFPGELSGGEQRRVVIARALTNSPRYLLADEPTSDLDEDTETDIIGLLERLRLSENIGVLIVAHDLRIAKRADRSFEMRNGVLHPAEIPDELIPEFTFERQFGPSICAPDLEAIPQEEAADDAVQLGSGFWAAAWRLLAVGGLAFFLIMLIDYGLAYYQNLRLVAERERRDALESLALAGLRSDVQTVRNLGDGQYELTIYFWNVSGGKPIYVMSSGVQAYVQVGNAWQEVTLRPVDKMDGSVVEVSGKQLYKFNFEARPERFTELLPHYMHVRFVNNLVVSPSKIPKDDLFERKDSYYVYLKPWNATDSEILKDMKFPGAPPTWIPMPPH